MYIGGKVACRGGGHASPPRRNKSSESSNCADEEESIKDEEEVWWNLPRLYARFPLRRGSAATLALFHVILQLGGANFGLRSILFASRSVDLWHVSYVMSGLSIRRGLRVSLGYPQSRRTRKDATVVAPISPPPPTREGVKPCRT